ncbi:MAG: DUF2189 domain-containing protein [Rhodoferax sp.]|nr:DUF2189 domain-containing protein [Rhodoferax sp.]
MNLSPDPTAGNGRSPDLSTASQVTPASPAGPAPYVPPPSEAPLKEIITLRLSDPFRWLLLGWRDLMGAKGISLFYGICFWTMAMVLGAVFRSKPEFTMSIASGCLLVGPFLAMGLYEVSRRREQGITPDLGASLTCWDSHLRSMGMLVLVLIVLELLWGRASLVVFAVFFNTGMPSTTGVIQAVFNPENWEFLAVYAVVGGVFAGLVYATAVVSIPMILDRDTDAISAAITSLQVVFGNTAVMLLWGALLSGLVFVALIPWGVGLLIIGPWLGHASWHAYRGSVRWLDEDGAVVAS